MKFNDMTLVQKRMVYQWMYEGLTRGLAEAVRAQSYQLFVLSAKGQATYDGEECWKRLRGPQRDHFDHVAKCAGLLKTSINELSKELLTRGDDHE